MRDDIMYSVVGAMPLLGMCVGVRWRKDHRANASECLQTEIGWQAGANAGRDLLACEVRSTAVIGWGQPRKKFQIHGCDRQGV